MPCWIFMTSRNFCGRSGYLSRISRERPSALAIRKSILSSSETGSLHEHDLLAGDVPLSCSSILFFHPCIAASNLLMTSRALFCDFILSELSMSHADEDALFSTRYRSSPRLSFPGCRSENNGQITYLLKKRIRNIVLQLLLYLGKYFTDYFWYWHFKQDSLVD